MNDKYLAILHGICARLYNSPLTDEDRGKLADTLATCLSDMLTDVIEEAVFDIRKATRPEVHTDEAKE